MFFLFGIEKNVENSMSKYRINVEILTVPAGLALSELFTTRYHGDITYDINATLKYGFLLPDCMMQRVVCHDNTGILVIQMLNSQTQWRKKLNENNRLHNIIFADTFQISHCQLILKFTHYLHNTLKVSHT